MLVRGRDQGRFALFHRILEDDAANDDGDGGTDIADETKCRCGSRDIPRRHKCLQGYKRRLEIWPHSNTGYYLEREDATPGATDGEVDVETEADGHEEQSEPDRREVLPCLLYENTDDDGGNGEGDYEGKEVDSTQNGAGAEDGLKIQREEISAGNEDHAMGEADG